MNEKWFDPMNGQVFTRSQTNETGQKENLFWSREKKENHII